MPLSLSVNRNPKAEDNAPAPFVIDLMKVWELITACRTLSNCLK